MSLVRFNPVRSLWHTQNDFDRFFNHFPSRFFDSEVPVVDWSPRVDIAEDNDNFVIEAELPGLSKDNVKVTMKEDVLTIQGEKKSEKDVKESDIHLCERRHGKFSRSFKLPTMVNSKKIGADFTNGVLKLNLPKAAEAKPVEIEVSMN